MRENGVHYISGRGFIFVKTIPKMFGGTQTTERTASDKEIGHALRTGKLYNPDNVNLISKLEDK